MKYFIMGSISFQVISEREVKPMKEQLIKAIINNLEHTNEHFLKCILAYTNKLADNQKGGEK